ncbi:MAG TPA: FkbM family methyltransferase [Tepidisphaeraceae bacterium]|nr:FkbM family methyltransferase [Tepidisphaeraceae bacterium]
MGQFDESALILELIGQQPAGVMVDVGAHFGSTLKPYLQRGWRVIAAEPDSSKWEKLTALGAGQKFSQNFSLHRDAIGEHDQSSAEFYTSRESTGIASLIPFRESHERSASVRVKSLRSILREESVSQVDFLKVDTEGMDYAVLKGFPFEKMQPKIILTEFDELKTTGRGHDFRSLGDLLVSLNYTVFLSEWFPIVRYGGNHQWRSIRRYPCSLSDPKAWGNFIAVREDQIDIASRLNDRARELAKAA